MSHLKSVSTRSADTSVDGKIIPDHPEKSVDPETAAPKPDTGKAAVKSGIKQQEVAANVDTP